MSGDDAGRLARQLAFALEAEKLKRVLRQSYHLEGGRQENDAEHSWHLALMVLLVAEYAEPGLDLFKALKMALIHDIVEVDAGDTYCYDEAGNATRAAREEAAAARLFGLLPECQGRELAALWREFEDRRTPEARYAAALDRLQPLLLNFHTEGRSWREHGVTRAQVLAVNRRIEQGSPALWAFARGLIEEAARRGWLADGAPAPG